MPQLEESDGPGHEENQPAQGSQGPDAGGKGARLGVLAQADHPGRCQQGEFQGQRRGAEQQAHPERQLNGRGGDAVQGRQPGGEVHIREA